MIEIESTNHLNINLYSANWKLIVDSLPRSRKVFDWLEMAREDLRDARRDLEGGSYASAVFHAELSSQRSVKAVIAALGYEVPKTHKPTEVLRIVAPSSRENKQLRDKIEKIITYAITLEDQGTIPRYGWESIDRIVKPSEIYDKEKATVLMDNAQLVLKLSEEVVGDIDC